MRLKVVVWLCFQKSSIIMFLKYYFTCCCLLVTTSCHFWAVYIIFGSLCSHNCLSSQDLLFFSIACDFLLKIFQSLYYVISSLKFCLPGVVFIVSYTVAVVQRAAALWHNLDSLSSALGRSSLALDANVRLETKPEVSHCTICFKFSVVFGCAWSAWLLAKSSWRVCTLQLTVR